MEKILSLPRSVVFCLKHLPFRQAIKMPIAVAWNTKTIGGGKIVIATDMLSSAMIRIGFHKVAVCPPNDRTVLAISKGGTLVFEGTAHIGRGTKIHVANHATLTLGDNFAVSASSQFNCYKRISFGRDIQFSWDCLVMDSDTHEILDETGQRCNANRDIVFGDHVWIGCRTTILKGTTIPNHCVIGAQSLLSGTKFSPNTIIAGSPAKSIRKIGNWKL